MNEWEMRQGDCLDLLCAVPDGSVDCCVTSPPYFGLRDYGHAGQIGLEPTPQEYVARLVAVFEEVRRVLADDGTLWLNLGDSYAGNGSTGGAGKETAYSGSRLLPTKSGAGVKQKDLLGIPWRVAFALQDAGWYLRQDIIWHKPNPMPESVTDRCTKAHEYLFLLTKSASYHYDAEAIAEPANCPEGPSNIRQKYTDAFEAGDKSHRTKSGLTKIGPRDTRNKRSVWTVASQPCSEAHFAVYPPALIRPCIRAGCKPGGLVLDPFTGSGTTGIVAVGEGRRFVGLELNPDYVCMARRRLANTQAPLFDFAGTAPL